MRADFRDGERIRSVELTPEGAGSWRASVDGVELRLGAEPLDGGRLRLVTPEGVVIAEVTMAGSRRFVRLGNLDFVFEREIGVRRRREGPAGGGLEAPMPGVVTRVMAAPGDEVRKGQPLVVLEAMKMEHMIRAPRDGRVKQVNAEPGQMVAGGATLVEMEAEAAGG
jgi:3-methylcrotonyl-CoA carboxylase alpha subunit